MSELYRKWGRSIRREGPHLVMVDEAGEAVEDDGIFRTRALGEDVDLQAPDSAAVEQATRAGRADTTAAHNAPSARTASTPE